MARAAFTAVAILLSIATQTVYADDRVPSPDELTTVADEPVEAQPGPVEEPVGVWDRLAACEAGGNWAANTHNGFYGGLQFDASSWKAAGGWKYATRADYASRSQQIEIARTWLAMTSWRSWPACSSRLGLR